MNVSDRLRPSFTRLFVWLGLGLLVVLILSIFVGRYPKPYWMPPQLLFQDDMAQQLVVSLRLPRMIVALLLGMSLSAAGAVMQMIFRNPLVEPGFLGVTQGAAFGAALSILWISTAPLVIEGSATLFALLGMALSYYSGASSALWRLGAASGVGGHRRLGVVRFGQRRAEVSGRSVDAAAGDHVLAVGRTVGRDVDGCGLHPARRGAPR